MSDAAAFAALEDLKQVMGDLCEAAWQRQKFFAAGIVPLVLKLIWAVAARKRRQFDLYLDRLRLGRLRPPRLRRPRPAEATAESVPEIAPARPLRAPKPADPGKPPPPSRKLTPPLPGPEPRRFGWMLNTFPDHVLPPIIARMTALLQQDRLRALLAVAPQVARQLRPICRGLGIALIPELRLSERPRKPRLRKPRQPRHRRERRGEASGDGAIQAPTAPPPPQPPAPTQQMTFIPTAEQLRDRDRDRVRWRRWHRPI